MQLLHHLVTAENQIMNDQVTKSIILAHLLPSDERLSVFRPLGRAFNTVTSICERFDWVNNYLHIANRREDAVCRSL